ncbi:hypothetical protein [Ohessyouella blattaphilus]|uniref:hypothetical protein n=1 Tax=Ohessyouella blattaphilus TaxID=2949333 RepID=UPI003EB8B517
MQTIKDKSIELEINECRVNISFSDKPVDGVVENVKGILSQAYDERMESELSSIAKHQENQQ